MPVRTVKPGRVSSSPNEAAETGSPALYPIQDAPFGILGGIPRTPTSPVHSQSRESTTLSRHLHCRQLPLFDAQLMQLKAPVQVVRSSSVSPSVIPRYLISGLCSPFIRNSLSWRILQVTPLLSGFCSAPLHVHP